MPGYDLDRFSAESSAKEFVCVVCHQVPGVDEPRELSDCGHVFCAVCIKEATKVKRQCPIDKKPLAEEPKPLTKAFARMHRNLELSCDNKENGCEDTTTIGGMKEHVAKCRKQKVKCTSTGCGETVLREALEAHRKECGFAEVVCEICSKVIMRKDYEGHSSECKDTEMPCPVDGCPERVKGLMLNRHLAEYATRHIAMLARENIALKKEISGLKAAAATNKKAFDNLAAQLSNQQKAQEEKNRRFLGHLRMRLDQQNQQSQQNQPANPPAINPPAIVNPAHVAPAPAPNNVNGNANNVGEPANPPASGPAVAPRPGTPPRAGPQTNLEIAKRVFGSVAARFGNGANFTTMKATLLALHPHLAGWVGEQEEGLKRLAAEVVQAV